MSNEGNGATHGDIDVLGRCPGLPGTPWNYWESTLSPISVPFFAFFGPGDKPAMVCGQHPLAPEGGRTGVLLMAHPFKSPSLRSITDHLRSQCRSASRPTSSCTPRPGSSTRCSTTCASCSPTMPCSRRALQGEDGGTEKRLLDSHSTPGLFPALRLHPHVGRRKHQEEEKLSHLQVKRAGTFE